MATGARDALEHFEFELVAVVPPADHLAVVVLLFVIGHAQDVRTDLVRTAADDLHSSGFCGYGIGRAALNERENSGRAYNLEVRNGNQSVRGEERF